MKTPPRSSLAAAHLDTIRGLSAIAVVLGHVRGHLVSNEGLVDAKARVLNPAFWLLNHGSTAVMVFFVLSGFFIASTVRRAEAAGRWNWRGYADARLSRLLVPLVPALLLVVFWDRLGQWYVGEATYRDYLGRGGLDAYSISPTTFLGNVAFLQRIKVPTFGSDGALWSLANEFWYYVAFPLFYFALRPGRPAWLRCALAMGGVLTLASINRTMVAQFPVWLFGAAIAFVPPVRWASTSAFRWSSAALFLVATTRRWLWPSPPIRIEEYIVGLAFAIFVYGLLGEAEQPASPRYERYAGTLAGFSYTLYLVHLPVLIFLTLVVFKGGGTWHLNPETWLYILMLTVALIAYAVPIWYLFERRTKEIRALLDRLGGTRKNAAI